MAPTKQPYRPDIDGLRGFSILIALIYHGFDKALPGGFIGADVFFVISGYLITGQIYDSARMKDFSFLDFYSRRIRRIFPPVILMLTFVGIYGYFFLNLSDFTSLYKHIAGGSVFISNFILWQEVGYFDQSSALKPLLHLWSLAIEEQFYVFWPLLVFALTVMARRLPSLLGWSLMLVCLASFVMRIDLAQRDAIAAFYSPLSRFWELGLGGLLAVLELNNPDLHQRLWNQRARDITAIAGSVCLVICSFLLSGQDHFPSLLATLPALASVAIIAAGPRAVSNRWLLSNKPMIQLGLISYALYLWHWPLMSFMRIEGGGHASAASIWLALAISFVLAILTRSWVEQPIRRHPARSVPLLLLAAFICLGVVGLAGYKSESFRPERLVRQAEIHEEVKTAFGAFDYDSVPSRDCTGLVAADSPAFRYCRIAGAPDARYTIAVWGDSMSSFWIPPFLAAVRDNGWRLVQFSHFNCPAMIGVQREDRADLDCRTPALAAQIMDALRRAQPDVVFLIGRWNLFYHGHIRNDVLVEPSFISDGAVKADAESARNAFGKYMPETIRQLAEFSRVVVFKGTPVMKVPVEVGVSNRPDTFEPTREETTRLEADTNRIIDEAVANTPRAVAFDPTIRLCNATKCPAYIDGLPAYFDEVHFTAHAAMQFLPDIKRLGAEP